MITKLFNITAILAACIVTAAAPGGADVPEGGERVHYSEVLSLTAQHPHSDSSFTQGLFFYGTELYESTGLYGKSLLYKNIDPETGRRRVSLSLMTNILQRALPCSAIRCMF